MDKSDNGPAPNRNTSPTMKHLEETAFDSSETLIDAIDELELGSKRSTKKYSVRFSPQIEQIVFFDSIRAVNDLGVDKALILNDNQCQSGSVSTAEQRKYRLMTNGNCKLFLGRLYGLAKVLNLQYEKEVYCRYTVNEWTTWSEIKMIYIYSKFGHDYFQFEYPISGPTTFKYCIRIVMGKELWDNNGGMNYSCLIRLNNTDYGQEGKSYNWDIGPKLSAANTRRPPQPQPRKSYLAVSDKRSHASIPSISYKLSTIRESTWEIQ